MTEIKDLEPCGYLPIDCEHLVAVGWLSEDSTFETGRVTVEFYEKLRQLAVRPFEPIVAGGLHQCELCQFDGPSFGSNLFIPFAGKIYVAPSGILHYIATHRYKPPQIFIDAVDNCPEMRSMAYFKEILENGGRGLVRSLRQT